MGNFFDIINLKMLIIQTTNTLYKILKRVKNTFKDGNDLFKYLYQIFTTYLFLKLDYN